MFRSSHWDSFRKYLVFFSRSNLFMIFEECPLVPRTDMNFPGGSICSSNRHKFSRRVYMFFEQTRIFQEGLSKKYVFSRRFCLFVEQSLLSHRTGTNFPRKPLFSSRTHTNFPGASIFSSNRYSFSRKSYLVLEHLRFSRRPLCLDHNLSLSIKIKKNINKGILEPARRTTFSKLHGE